MKPLTILRETEVFQGEEISKYQMIHFSKDTMEADTAGGKIMIMIKIVMDYLKSMTAIPHESSYRREAARP